MAIILAQKAIQSVLRVGLLQLKNNIEARNIFLENFNQFDATFQNFNQYATQLGIAIDNFIEPKEEINTFIKNSELEIKLGYPRLHAKLPEICLVLGADGEGSGSIGDIADETMDEQGNMSVDWSSDKHRTITIHIIDDNPDALEILYQAIDFVLVTHRTLLTQMGLNNCRFDAGDVHPNQEGLASGLFLFERIVTVTCDIYQTYKSTFYGYSPMPMNVAFSSNIEDEAEIDVNDLVEDEDVEETLPNDNPCPSGPYEIGAEIPTEDVMPLFRGSSLETTPTVEIIKGLSVQTFEQSIVGEFIFESIADNSFIYFAYPQSLGEIIFKDDADVIQSFFRENLSLDDSNGDSVLYYAYRSELPFTGIKTLIITKI